MHAPEPTSPMARRELVLVATMLVGLARLADPSDAFLVAGLLPLAVLMAGSVVFGGDEAPTRPYESILLPAVLAGGAAAAIHLVPAGVWVVVALGAFAVLLDRVVALEMRLLAQPGGVTDGDRSRVMLYTVATAFIAFTGMATLVPAGLAEPGGTTAAGGSSPSEVWLLVLALDDALVALILGYRVAALHYGSAREAARSALTYGIVIAIAAGAIRAIDLPRLVGPAILTLVFYLWDAQHGSAPARRREPRFLWEMVLLGALAIVVIAWNLRLHG